MPAFTPLAGSDYLALIRFDFSAVIKFPRLLRVWQSEIQVCDPLEKGFQFVIRFSLESVIPGKHQVCPDVL
jgi:hypothetical protein